MPFNDGFRHLRNQIENSAILCSPRLNYTHKAPVIARTDVAFLSEFPEHLLDSLARRKKHCGTGLFSPQHLPFKTFGNLKHTDTFEWVADYFDISPPKLSHLYQASLITVPLVSA